jgi:acylphosphatase
MSCAGGADVPTVGKRVLYSGRVQGVGFRYTARGLAQAYPDVAGYVRNLPDGEVELLAEGEPDRVEAFLAAVASRMAGYIARADVQDVPPTGLAGFQIRH